MKKDKLLLSPVKKIKGTYYITTKNIIEASIYYALGCYTYSYNILSHEGKRVELVIGGDDIKKTREIILTNGSTVEIRKFIDRYNYLVDFTENVIKDTGSSSFKSSDEGGIK